LNQPDNSHAELLAQSVSAYVQHGADLPRVRALAQTQLEFDPKQWQELADLGWLGILAPESCGGLGLGLAEVAIVAEGLGRALTPEPYTPVAVLAAAILTPLAGATLPMAILNDLVAGLATPVLAAQEQADDFSAQLVATVATPQTGGIQLDGVKSFVVGAAGASGFLVTAHHEQEPLLCWVPGETQGCHVRLIPLADGRTAGEVRLDHALVSEAHILARGARVRELLDCALDYAQVITAAELLGVLKKTQEMSLEYMKTRIQFGKAIGSFQVLQHRAVDLLIQQELAAAVLAEVIQEMSHTPMSVESRAMAASRAKARCADAALMITRAAIQFHGAIGFTEDCDVGLYVKRAMTLAAYLGNSRAHRQRYARLAAVGHQEAA